MITNPLTAGTLKASLISPLSRSLKTLATGQVKFASKLQNGSSNIYQCHVKHILNSTVSTVKMKKLHNRFITYTSIGIEKFEQNYPLQIQKNPKSLFFACTKGEIIPKIPQSLFL